MAIRPSYSFDTLNSVFSECLATTRMTYSQQETVKKELNKFFKDSKCVAVYYTENISKPFFGMIVCPRIPAENIYDYLMGDDTVRLSEYSIEIDSHIFNPILGLTAEEVTAILLHEIGHVVNDTTPIENARRYLDEYMAKNHDTIKMSDSYHYREILAYALKDFVSKDRSIFYTANVDEVLADDFIHAYGYTRHLEHAMTKILRNNSKLYQGQYNDRFVTFIWTINLYKNMQYRRIPALRSLNRAKAMTASRIEKAEMENLIRRINRIDDSSLLEGAFDTACSKMKARMKKMRIDNLRSIEEDYYELNMRIRNVEDEDDALYLMRQLNTRISIITDFIESEDLDKNEVKRWNESRDRFCSLRDTLSKSMTYKSKNLGVFVQYPDIVANRY